MDTAEIGAGDGYALFAERLEREFGHASTPLADAPLSFAGRIGIRVTPTLAHLAFAVDNNVVSRLRPQIRRLEWGQYHLYREHSDGAWFDIDGHEFVTAHGDLVLYDSDLPMRTRGKAAYRHHLWMIPRAMLDPHLPARVGRLAIHIPASSEVAPLVLAYVDALAGSFDRLQPTETTQIADNLGRLLAIVCGSNAAAHGVAVAQARLDRSRQYIERNLTSPDLDSEKVASALGMSVRQLHLLFEPTGESFGQYLRRRRLQECRSTLESPLAAGRSVTDIAFAWGFSSLPTFYRAFSNTFGMAPSDLRPGHSAQA
jgi:AraC-like DNA-binding protein